MIISTAVCGLRTRASPSCGPHHSRADNHRARTPSRVILLNCQSVFKLCHKITFVEIWVNVFTCNCFLFPLLKQVTKKRCRFILCIFVNTEYKLDCTLRSQLALCALLVKYGLLVLQQITQVGSSVLSVNSKL